MSDSKSSLAWKIYDPDAAPVSLKAKLPPPPPWRQPGPARRDVIANTFRATPEVVDAVNVAIHLRRPLLVTGKPGTGKSSLVYSVARQLGLGEVLVWGINSRSTLADGLYRYDALARLQQIQELQIRGSENPTSRLSTSHTAGVRSGGDDIGAFITLGPLGSALAAEDAPRALLIDEIDKSDVDLPNDLLGVLDTGSFPIPELKRVALKHPTVLVQDVLDRAVSVKAGVVSFTEYPLIVMTSNGERDFPAPFLRRCVQCTLPDPEEQQLRRILQAHFGAIEDDPDLAALLETFLSRRTEGGLANDQLLNAQHIALQRKRLTPEQQERLLDILFKSLTG